MTTRSNPRPMPVNDHNFTPKHIWLTCPVCKKQFPYGAARYRFLVKRGKTVITCSRQCGSKMRWGEKAQEVAG